MAVLSALAGAAWAQVPKGFEIGREVFPVYRSLFENEFSGKNLLTMSDFEFDLGPKPDGFPWRAEALDADGKVKGPMPILIDDGNAESGDRSAKVVLPAEVTVRVIGPATQVFPGKSYTFSLYVMGKKVEGVALGATAQVRKADGSEEVIEIAPAPMPADGIGEKEFIRLQRVLTAPEGCFTLRPVMLVSGAALIWFDAAQLEEGTGPSDHWTSAAEDALEGIVESNQPRSGAGAAGGEHAPIFAFDGRLDTGWTPATGKLPCELSIQLPDEADLKGIRVVFADAQHRPTALGATIQALEMREWRTIPVTVTDAGSIIDYEFDESVMASELRYRINAMLPSDDAAKSPPMVREIYFWFDE
jgi:hypothetical protein